MRISELADELEQIGELLPIWDGANCVPTHEEITRLLDTKRAEVLARVRDLERFAEQLEDIRAVLEEDPPPAACRPDLSCCVPATEAMLATPIAGLPTSTRRPTAGTSSI